MTLRAPLLPSWFARRRGSPQYRPGSHLAISIRYARLLFLGFEIVSTDGPSRLRDRGYLRVSLGGQAFDRSRKIGDRRVRAAVGDRRASRAGRDPDRPAPRRPSGLVHRSQRAGGDAGPAGFLGADATSPGYGDHGAASARATAACCGRGAGTGRSVARRRPPATARATTPAATAPGSTAPSPVPAAGGPPAAGAPRTAAVPASTPTPSPDAGPPPPPQNPPPNPEPPAVDAGTPPEAAEQATAAAEQAMAAAEQATAAARQATAAAEQAHSGACASPPRPASSLLFRTHVGDRRAVGAHPAGTRWRLARRSHVHARRRTARSRCAEPAAPSLRGRRTMIRRAGA